MPISWAFSERNEITESEHRITRNLGPKAHHLFCQFNAGHVRHGHVGNDEIEFIRLRFKGFQSFCAAGPDLHL